MQGKDFLKIPLKGNMKFEMESLARTLTVSYTHLDVYKRQVVLRTPMMELLQFEPSTPKVGAIPLRLIPPWVNKYYLFDWQQKTSFIKWAVDEGYTVFAISWVNPTEAHAEKDFEDYWLEGPMAAFDAMEKITGQRHVNIFSYCLGGTLTVSGLAYLAAKGDDRVASATMLSLIHI